MNQGDLFGACVEPLEAIVANRYRCISLDPPWLERGGGKICRGAQRHYPLMPTPEIIDLVRGSAPVASLAPSAHAWCWVTDNFLEDGLLLLRALGFRYVRTLCWAKVLIVPSHRRWRLGLRRGAPRVKLQRGLGQYLRGAHELCLFGVRGDAMVPPPANRGPSVVFAPRGRHSAKPAEAYAVIERVSPGSRVEMFARIARPGWDAWGNEAPAAA